MADGPEPPAGPPGVGVLADWSMTRLFAREGGRLDMDTSGE